MLVISNAALGVQMQGLERQIEAEQGVRSAPGKSRAEEEYFLARLVADAERREIARLQKEVSCNKTRLMLHNRHLAFKSQGSGDTISMELLCLAGTRGSKEAA